MPNVACHVQIDRFVRVTSDSNDTWRSTDTGMSAIIVDDVVCPAMYRLTPPVYKVILPTTVVLLPLVCVRQTTMHVYIARTRTRIVVIHIVAIIRLKLVLRSTIDLRDAPSVVMSSAQH